MTATDKKTVHRTNKKFNIKKSIPPEYISELLLWFSVAFSAGRATIADIPLTILSLAVVSCADDIARKAAAALGAIIILMISAITDMTFVPYLIGIIIYVSAYQVLKNEKYSLLSALSFILAAKVMLFSATGGQSVVYIFLECIAVYFLQNLVKSAGEIAHKGIISLTDFITVFIVMLAVTFTLSGADSRIVYVGRAVSLALSWLWRNTYDYISSLIGLSCFFVGLMDKKGFELLFGAGIVIWITGLISNQKDSIVIYPVTILISAVVNLTLLMQINSFAFLGTVIFALIIYRIIPGVLKIKRPQRENLYINRKDYHRLASDMKKLEQSLSFLGNCAIDISKLNEKNLSPQPLEDMVAEDVCRKCSANSHCWQEKYSFTAGQFAKYAKSMNWAENRGFDMAFYSRCKNVEKVKASFEENNRLLISRKYIVQSQKNNQKLLQSAFMSVSQAVGDMLYLNSTSRMVNSSFTMQLDRYLENLGINGTYCLCSQNPDMANFGTPDPVEGAALYKIKNKLEQIYGEKFTGGDFEKQGREYIYSFYATPKYRIRHSAESKAYRDINGDSYMVFGLHGMFYALLSDGMGTGSRRAAESRTVVAMAKSLLDCGVSLHSMMNIVNLALNLRGNGENGATLEVLEIDLYTGKAILTKAGAGVTVVFNEKGVERYTKDSLPIGILKDIKYTTDEFILTENDTILLMSDGVGNISSNIANLFDKSCRDIAYFAINENKIPDDKTVIAIRLEIF